ncbi:phosphatase PAP2 family protein [Pseudoluteimonas lycopersici]|uniref:phosphatase PAP2 family protein n=1 Tax=Pseudoluteimonas lycopersici TaxID=1324796 RepID=UPI00163DA0E0|nr:phosphatase PAP2 family protein [Lysobacter lycopersici]
MSTIPLVSTTQPRRDIPNRTGGSSAWWRSPVAAPLAALLLASIVLVPMGGDRWIADRIFAAEGAHWTLRGSFVLTRVLHGGGKALSTLAWLGVLAMTLRATIDARWKPLRRPLLVLLLSVAVSTLLVSSLKHLTRMDCPWDAAIYGGSHPYFTLLQARPAGIKPSGCFPAGQASAGYAWVALYFFFASVRPAWRRIGLAIGIGAGAILGIAQQLRGAHYLSHDLWTLAICWFVALAIHRLSVRRTVHPGMQAANDGDRSS